MSLEYGRGMKNEIQKTAHNKDSKDIAWELRDTLSKFMKGET